jgi:hypothetical protein
MYFPWFRAATLLDFASCEGASLVSFSHNQIVERTVALFESSKINYLSLDSIVSNDKQHSTCSMCLTKPADIKLTPIAYFGNSIFFFFFVFFFFFWFFFYLFLFLIFFCGKSGNKEWS